MPFKIVIFHSFVNVYHVYQRVDKTHMVAYWMTIKIDQDDQVIYIMIHPIISYSTIL